MEKSETDLKKFQVVGSLNNGTYGLVNKVKEIETGKIYAAKTLTSTDDLEKSIDREVDIMLFTNHPAIIKFIGYSRKDFTDSDNLTIIMDYAQNESLSKILEQISKGKKIPKYTNTTRQIILAGIACGMQYLHKHNIIHRDLKPQNILLDENFYPYITDFGLSKYFLEGHSQSQSIFSGTVIYEAPEINNDVHYDTKIDVYAFAIIMYQIVSDLYPYPELEKKKVNPILLLNKIISGYRPDYTKVKINKHLKRLIEKCWANNPDSRPPFSEIFEKLSNMNGDNKYLLDDVDLNVFNRYIKHVSKVDKRLEKHLDRVIEIKNQTKQLSDQNKALTTANEELEEKYNQQTSEFENLKSEKDELTDEINRLQRENAKGKKKSKKSETESTAIKEIIDKYEALLSENEQLKTNYEKYIRRIDTLEKNNQKLDDSNKELTKNLSLMKKQKVEILKENEQLENNNVLLETEKKEQSGRIDRLLRSNSKLRAINRDLKNSLDKEDKSETKKKSDLDENKTAQHNFTNLLEAITVSTFNSYPSVFQQIISKKLSKSTLIDDANQLFTSLNDFFCYLYQFDQMVTTSIEIITNNVTLLKDINDECSVLIHHDSLEVLFKNNSLESPELIRILNEFDDICFEIKFPIESFDDFYNCILSIKKSLTEKRKVSISVIISDSEEEHHFDNDSNINFVEFDSSVKSIGCFTNCTSIKQMEIPSSITSIDDNSFNGCTSLNQIILTSSVTKIGENAFNGCYSLVQITIPSSVVEIGSNAFCGCSALTKVIIQCSLTELKDETFKGCSSLAEISIPHSVSFIGQSAFHGCSSLKEIEIPSSVKIIEENCFLGCISLKKVTFESKCNLTSIKEKTFSGCSSLEAIDIPSSIAFIDRCAFSGCSSLKQVTFKTKCNINSIKDGAFMRCTSLTTINIPFSVILIGDCAFSDCTSLNKVTIPSSVKFIQDSTFINCSSLTHISIPNSVTHIGSEAFRNCSKLKSVFLSSAQITSINQSTFFSCLSLEQIKLPNSVTEICNNAFCGCLALSEITIPQSVKKIGNGAFCGCTNLQNVYGPSTITINNDIFAGCSPLLHITQLKDRPLSLIFSTYFKK